MSFDWTAERIAELRRLVDQGVTYAEIGKRLGCGKNAALSKAQLDTNFNGTKARFGVAS